MPKKKKPNNPHRESKAVNWLKAIEIQESICTLGAVLAPMKDHLNCIERETHLLMSKHNGFIKNM